MCCCGGIKAEAVGLLHHDVIRRRLQPLAQALDDLFLPRRKSKLSGQAVDYLQKQNLYRAWVLIKFANKKSPTTCDLGTATILEYFIRTGVEVNTWVCMS